MVLMNTGLHLNIYVAWSKVWLRFLFLVLVFVIGYPPIVKVNFPPCHTYKTLSKTARKSSIYKHKGWCYAALFVRMMYLFIYSKKFQLPSIILHTTITQKPIYYKSLYIITNLYILLLFSIIYKRIAIFSPISLDILLNM